MIKAYTSSSKQKRQYKLIVEVDLIVLGFRNGERLIERNHRRVFGLTFLIGTGSKNRQDKYCYISRKGRERENRINRKL